MGVFDKKIERSAPDLPKLANDLNMYAERLDPYEYRDTYEDANPLSEEAYRQYLIDMTKGDVGPYIRELESDLQVVDYTSDPKLGRMAKSLVRRMKTVGSIMGTYNMKPKGRKSNLWRKLR